MKYGGSSPHTRGARRLDAKHHHRIRIIPAYAGSTPLGCQASSSHQDHPRIRGEHGATLDRWHAALGSSPHTRGALASAAAGAGASGIIPAYAGSTELASSVWAFRAGSSPHTRGAQGLNKAVSSLRRIIPAYAGSTWTFKTA